MFVHEYSDKEFENYEDCREDLIGQIWADDVVQHFHIPMERIIAKFLNRKNNQEFLSWLEQEIDVAYEKTLDELITEYDEGEVD